MMTLQTMGTLTIRHGDFNMLYDLPAAARAFRDADNP
jgi:hypothetical protein